MAGGQGGASVGRDRSVRGSSEPGRAGRSVAVEVWGRGHPPHAASMSSVTLRSLGCWHGHRLQAPVGGRRLRILVDCGLFQGEESSRTELGTSRRRARDHRRGRHHPRPPRPHRLPAAAGVEGFSGPIFCTDGTAAVAEIILRDSAAIQERDAAYLNKRHATKHHPAPATVRRRGRPAGHRPVHHPAVRPGVRPADGGPAVTFRRAGHILGRPPWICSGTAAGSCSPGILGRHDDPIMLDPEPVRAADYLVMESTYGDRLHDRVDPVEALAEIINPTVHRGGTVLILAFAVGRAQMLLYYMWRLRLAEGCRRYRSTRLADGHQRQRSTAPHPNDHRLAPEVYEDMCAMATYTRAVPSSPRGSPRAGPEGRHLRQRDGHRRPDPAPPRGVRAGSAQRDRADRVSGPGTRGRSIVAGEPQVRIHGEWVHQRPGGEPEDDVRPRRCR